LGIILVSDYIVVILLKSVYKRISYTSYYIYYLYNLGNFSIG